MARPPIHLSHTVKAVHLILTGYGHWLPNDPRGSGSTTVHSDLLAPLGAVHHGRRRVQPSREMLRGFYENAEPRLLHPVVWFDAFHREAMAQAIGHMVRNRGYTVWALALLRNHVHVVLRTHRDKADDMWNAIAHATRERLQTFDAFANEHPVWSERPYKVFLTSDAQVAACVRYVEQNPVKEGLGLQRWDCVTQVAR